VKVKVDSTGNISIQIKTCPVDTLKQVDTAKIRLSDLRRLNIALDSMNYYKGLSIQNKAKYDAQVIETAEEHKRGNKWILYFWMAVATIIGSHILRSKFL